MLAPRLTFRTAAPADLDRLIEIHSSAYPDPRGHEERRKKFVANPRGDLGTLHVAEDGGQIVAHAFLFPLRAWFARGVVPIGGIASVAVAPEARGRGVASALLSHLHQRADAAGAAVTMLYPFRQGYYAKHGYAAVTPNRRLVLHPGAIPAAWRNEPGIAIRTVQVDLASPVADRTLIVNAYARTAARTHGWVARPPALWDHFFANERRVWLLATRGRRAAGYVCWSLAQTEPYAAIRLAVHELVADDAAARRVLLGAIGSQRDQVAEVEMEVDADDPIDRALVDADRGRFGSPEVEHPLGVLSGGPMVRLVDVSRGLAARTYAADGEIDVAIDRGGEGEHQASSSPALHVAISGGKAKLSVPTRPARAPLTIDRAALAAVLYGGLSASDAARLGWARGEDATLERADALFASSPFFALDAY